MAVSESAVGMTSAERIVVARQARARLQSPARLGSRSLLSCSH